MIKTVNVPVVIDGTEDEVRLVKYKAMDIILREAKYLGNKAIRFCIAYDLSVGKERVFQPTDEEGNTVAIATATYRHLAKERRFLPAGSMASLSNNYASKMYRAHNKLAWRGEKSLPTYRNPILPIRHAGTKITAAASDDEKQFLIVPDGFSSGGWLSDELLKEAECKAEIAKGDKPLVFRTVFSWKDAGSIAILERVISGEYTVKDSTLRKAWKFDKASGKKKPRFFFAMVYEIPDSKVVLDKSIVCGVDLGVMIPVYAALSNSPKRMSYGSFEDVWAARSKFRAQRRRKQARLGMRSKRTDYEMSEAERNWVNNFYHGATRSIIKFALQNNCGTIHIEDLTALRTRELAEDNSDRQRVVWVPSKLAQMLDYKCKEFGIDLVKINPRNTSRRCSSCGHIDKASRVSQSKYICVNCGEEMNADYNAARNIALAAGEVIKSGYLLPKPGKTEKPGKCRVLSLERMDQMPVDREYIDHPSKPFKVAGQASLF